MRPAVARGKSGRAWPRIFVVAQPVPVRSRGTILIVDDSPVIRSVVKIYLEDRGIRVLEAENGERALRILKVLAVDAIVADIKMPRVNGIELVRQLRADPDLRLRATPVILVTGERAASYETDSLLAGANAFLRKPVSASSLVPLVESLLPPKAQGVASK
jgi:two-component system chemotaxis response regulator CheY